MIWFEGSSLYFPSNFGMLEIKLVGKGGQLIPCCIKSLVNLVRSSKFKVTNKENFVVETDMGLCLDQINNLGCIVLPPMK